MSLKFIVPVGTQAEWEEQVQNAPATQLCVVDVHTKWCGPCVALGKRITNLSSDYIDYDIKWVEACADNIPKFDYQVNKSKPLIILFKCGLEVARMNLANGNELARLVQTHCGEKKAA